MKNNNPEAVSSPAEPINYFIFNGIKFETDATITFFHHPETDMLSMNINMSAQTDDEKVDEDVSDLVMYAEGVPTDIADISELKGKKFCWGNDSKLCGWIACLEWEPNNGETIEFLEVTEDKILVSWSGLGSIGYGILGTDKPFEAVFEAKIKHEDTDKEYPGIKCEADNGEKEAASDKETPDDNDFIWSDASKKIVCEKINRTNVVLYHTKDSYLIWFTIMVSAPENFTVLYVDSDLIGKKAADISELDGQEFTWTANGQHGWSDCEHNTSLKINSITNDKKINVTLRSYWKNADTDVAVEVTFEDKYSIQEIGDSKIVKYSENPRLRLVY